MKVPELPGVLTASDLVASAASIAAVQRPSGLIPWFPGEHGDPWDHVEAAMALDVCGFRDEALAAYRWLVRNQRPDGSWASKYNEDGSVREETYESNHAAYVAVGVWHHWKLTGDDYFLSDMWPTVVKALDFVLALQEPGGEIRWSRSESGADDDLVLVTGCSSMHHGLRAGLALADRMESPQPDWELAVGQLRHALLCHPSAFEDKDRFSMDWYYPVLGGACRGGAGLARIEERWQEFVVPNLGIRCVSDRPWVTGAETCELAIALDTLGERDLAIEMVASMQHLREKDGSYWTGYVFDEDARWPEERSTWTAAAVILAVDALTGTGAHSAVFRADDMPLGVEVGDVCELDRICTRQRS